MTVGFIGLGAMGSAMARNLLNAGITLYVYNRSQEVALRLEQCGAHACELDEIFRLPIVISMLSDDEAVRDVLLHHGFLEKAQTGCIHVNMATVSAEFAQYCAIEHQKRGITYISAPVFGRSDVAALGKLSIIASGSRKAIDKVKPLFDAMGQKMWYLGEKPESASVVKLCGNFMIASAI